MESILVGGMHKNERGRPMQHLEGTATLMPSEGSLPLPSNFSVKMRRGQPLASGKRENLSLLGGGFTPYVIIVNRGEEVLEKISSISQKGSYRAFVLSANGSLYHATVRHPGSPSSVKYEGSFDIISISGSFTSTERDGVRCRTNCMSMSMAGLDGRVYGGEVAGPLMAASPIQVVIGTSALKCRKRGQKKRVHEILTTTVASTSNERAEAGSNCHASGEEKTQVNQSSISQERNPGEATLNSDSTESLNCPVYDANCPNLLPLFDDC